MSQLVVVAAAVIERDGAFLLTRRLEGTHLEGTWEFPGGKCEPLETPAACLVREIREELGTAFIVGELLLVTRHAYADRTVELHFYEGRLSGDPVPQIGQEMRWARREELPALEFPDADAEVIEMLVSGRHHHGGGTARQDDGLSGRPRPNLS
jgi:8-oxo-dGTP diphosphatase